jgi:hypothetical protein
MEKTLTKANSESKPECFVIMPIADPEGYAKGHFQRVYEDLITPACNLSGYKSVRADDVRQTNLIHLDVLQKLVESPMAICDLSGRTPNVLFELGLRQAFDKPVVLIQEVGTPKIFDITPLRYTEYRKERVYNEVLEDQKKIAAALGATRDATQQSINSIVRLLSITKPATLPDVETNRDPALQVIMAELNNIRTEMRQMSRSVVRDNRNVIERYMEELNSAPDPNYSGGLSVYSTVQNAMDAKEREGKTLLSPAEAQDVLRRAIYGEAAKKSGV